MLTRRTTKFIPIPHPAASPLATGFPACWVPHGVSLSNSSCRYPAGRSRRRRSNPSQRRLPVSRARTQAYSPDSSTAGPVRGPSNIGSNTAILHGVVVAGCCTAAALLLFLPTLVKYPTTIEQLINNSASAACFVLSCIPANACAVARAALFIFLAGACGPLIFRSLPPFERMLTWRDDISGGWWPMRCHNETSSANMLPQPASNRSASWKGDWWHLNVEDVMPTWGDAPTAEEFWYCVVALLALGILRRLYIYVRELWFKDASKALRK